MLLRRFFFVVIGLSFAQFARADHHILYECVDPDGNRQFTNIAPPAKSKTVCKVLNVSPINTVPGTPKPAGKAASASPSPANFPRVDPATQQSRDSQRRRILEQELGNEQKLLEQAKKDLAEQEATRLGNERNYQRMLDRIEPYQKKVKLHEDNIANLRKELGNLR